MAATVTHRGTTFNTTAGNKTVVATPAANDLIVVIAAATGATTSSITDTQSGTYVQVDTTRTGFSTTGNLQAFVRTALVPAASSTTFTATQTSSTGGGLSVISVSGMSLTGASAIRSSGGQSTGTAGTTPAPVLSLTPLSSNPIITAIGNASGTTTTVVQRTGYTEDFDNGYSTPTTGLEVSHLASGETSATITYGGTSATAFASIALELQFNTAPTVALNTPADTGTVATTTPDLVFTGTDADSNTIEYEVQVDSVNTFDSQSTSIVLANKVIGQNTASGTTIATSAFSATAGNLIFVAARASANGATMSVADTAGNNYIQIGSTIDNTGLGDMTIWYAKNIAGNASNVVTATWSASNSNRAIVALEYSGLDRTSPLDVATTPVSTTTPSASATSGTFTTTVANEVIIAAGAWDNGTAASAGSIGGTTATLEEDTASALTGLAVEDRIVSGIQTGITAAMSTNGSGDWILFVVSFKKGTQPLLNKYSSTPDATFTDVTNGAHTHPFPSGEQVKYTIQAGNALTNGNTYFWRVSAIDPSGTNTYGAWATTRSFTVNTTPSVVKTLGTLGVG